MEDEVNRLDKAFEWIVLFITLSYATIFQLLSWFLGHEYIGPMFFAVRFMFIPLIIIIFAWLGKFVAAEPKKMFFRKFAWSWGMFFLGFFVLAIIFIVTADPTTQYSPV